MDCMKRHKLTNVLGSSLFALPQSSSMGHDVCISWRRKCRSMCRYEVWSGRGALFRVSHQGLRFVNDR